MCAKLLKYQGPTKTLKGLALKLNLAELTLDSLIF